MPRRRRQRAGAFTVAAVLVLTASLDGQAAAPAALDLVEAGATVTATADYLGWPTIDMVSITQRGGLTDNTRNATMYAAAAFGIPASLSRGFQLGLRRMRRGATVVQQSSGDGWGIPMAVSALPVETVGAVMGREVSEQLAAGRVVLGSTSAALRGAQVGDVLELITPGGWIASFPIGMIAPDSVVGGTEIVMSTAQADTVGMVSSTRVLLYGEFDRSVVADALAWAGVSTNPNIRVSRSWDAPGPDDTLGLAATKVLLGEFDIHYAGLVSSQWVAVNPAWKATFLPASRRLYSTGILARCHNVLHADLEAALAEVQATLPELVNSSSNSASQSTGLDIANANTYGGCSTGSARLSRVGVSGGVVSRHSWGQALDVSTVSNCQGCVPKMDCRIVRIFRKHGFAWGGNFLTPDGMHFEWVGEARHTVGGSVKYCPNILPAGEQAPGGGGDGDGSEPPPTIRDTLFADDGWLGDVETE